MEHIVDFVLISVKRKLPIVLDVIAMKGIHSGVSVSFMLALGIMKLSTVDYAKIFHVIYS